jgi:hypothetical protein
MIQGCFQPIMDGDGNKPVAAGVLMRKRWGLKWRSQWCFQAIQLGQSHGKHSGIWTVLELVMPTLSHWSNLTFEVVKIDRSVISNTTNSHELLSLIADDARADD